MSHWSISHRSVWCISRLAAWTVAIALVGVAAQAQLHKAWMESWDGPLPASTDGGYAVASDSTGNTYVAGDVATAANGSDGLLIKYDRSGKLLWERTYDGPGADTDYFTYIRIDSNDQILLLGQSIGNGTDWDFLTIKYSPSGALLWEQRYDGLGSGQDLVYGIDVDTQDNVCIVGVETGADGFPKFTTIKYLADGTEDWVRRYESSYPGNINAWGFSVHVTDDGTVYAAGDAISSTGSLDFALLKYDSDGTLLWDRLFDGLYGAADALYDMALGPNEELYLTGISETGTGFEYCVAKYNSSGDFQWEGRYGGTTGYHYPYLIDVDQAGNAVVTGPSTNSAGYFDWATVRFDSNGALQWARRYRVPSPYFGENIPNGLVLDDQGGIYVCGAGSNWLTDGQNAAVLKYDAAGNLVWSDTFNGEASGDDSWWDITLDDSNQVLVTGVSLGAGTGLDLLVAKYRQNGPPTLTVSPMPLVPGAPATFTVSNVEPGAGTYLAYSTVGTGTVHAGFLDVTLGLANPKKVGPIVPADVSGTAEWTFQIPGSVAGIDVWLQGVQYNVVTDVAATSVQ